MIAALISGGSFWNCATSASRTDLSLSSVIAPAAFASTSPLKVAAHAAMRTSASRSRISGAITSMSAAVSPPICASASQRRRLEFRAARFRERIDQRLAMRCSGFARLAEAPRRSDAHVAARVVEQWPNRVGIFRGRLRLQDDGEHGGADVWIGIIRVFEHRGDVRLRLRAEPREKLKRLHANGLGRFGREQFRDFVRGDRRLPPIGQRTHGQRGDFIGRIRERGDRAFHDGGRRFIRPSSSALVWASSDSKAPASEQRRRRTI